MSQELNSTITLKEEYIEQVTTIVTQVVEDFVNQGGQEKNIESIIQRSISEIIAEKNNTGKLDLSDDFGLRDRHPAISAMAYDSEVLFLITNVDDVKTPFGFKTTASIIIPRKFTKTFRSIFLNTYPAREYVKVPITVFFLLGRKYYFDFDGKEISLSQWIHSMEEFSRGGSEEADYKHMFVLIPKGWKLEATAIELYVRRTKNIKNGLTGAYTNVGGMKYSPRIDADYNRY